VRLALNVGDKIIDLAVAKAMAVVAWHGLARFPLDRREAGFHQQIKSAISILQLQRGVVFVPDHSGKLSTIPRRSNRCFRRSSGRPDNRITNLARLMIPGKPGYVFGDDLSSAVTCGATGLSEKKVTASHRVARRGLPRRRALQETYVANERTIIFAAQVWEARHSGFRNPLMDQIEQCLIRDRPHGQSAHDIWCVLSAEPVEPVARRAFRLKDPSSSEFRLRTRSGLFVRVLAEGRADCREGDYTKADRARKYQRQSNLCNGRLCNHSPSHIALRTTANLIYHRMELTQIKLFRFIGFHFVSKFIGQPAKRPGAR